MKIEILRDNLKESLNCLERIAKKNLSLPILNNILLSCEGNFLRLDATNLELSVSWWVLSKVIDKEGKTTVPAAFFSNLINLLREKNIKIESSDNKNLILKTINRKIQIQGMPPEEFPIIPKIKRENINEISSEKLQKGITEVVEIPSLSQIKPEISGLYFFSKKNKLKIVATDSFRLAEKTINLDSNFKKEVSFILPQETSRQLISILSQNLSEKINIVLSQNQILFEIPQKEFSKPKVQVFSRLIDGEFPKYQEIIPKSFKTKLLLDKEEFQENLKEAGLFSGRVSEVKLESFSKENKLGLFSQSSEFGKNESYIPAKIEGEDIKTSFNYKFLLAGLDNIESSQVVLELSNEEGPGVLKPVGSDDYFYILMPIKAS